MFDTNQLFPLEYHGHGVLFIGEEEFATGSFRLQRGKYDTSAPFSFDALLIPKEGRNFTHYDVGREMAFNGTTSFDAKLIIPKFESVRFRSGRPFHLQAEARDLVIGSERLDYDPDRVLFRARLTPSDAVAPRFAVEVFDDDGQIIGETPILPQRIATDLGNMLVGESYDFEPLRGVTIEGNLRIRRNSAELWLDSEFLSRDLSTQLSIFREWLDDLCTILSFIARRRIEWFEIFAAISPGSAGGGPLQDRFDCFRAAESVGSRRLSTPILDVLKIPTNALDHVISQFRTHPLRDSIRLATDYLIASNNQGTLEARVVSAFTALECIVNAIGEADRTSYTMSSAKFKRLASAVRKTIRDYVATSELGERAAAETCEKVGELHRRAIVPRTVEVLDKHRTAWEDLWPAGTTLIQGLASAYRLRNTLVHAGHIADREEAQRSHLRIHTLTERLVFSLLEANAEWLHPYAYSHTRRLRELT